MDNYIPPHNINVEEALLGSILMDPDAITRVMTIVDAADFYIHRNGWIFNAILEMRLDGNPADFLTVCDFLQDRPAISEYEYDNLLEECGGDVYISKLVNVVPTALHAVGYAKIIATKAARRRMIQAAQEVASAACNDDYTLDDVIKRSETIIDALRAVTPIQGWEWHTLAQACEKKEDRERLLEMLPPLPSIVVIYGLPGTFKTLLAQDLAVCISNGRTWLDPQPGKIIGGFATKKVPVLWVDQDSGLEELERRFAALVAGLPANDDAPLYHTSFPIPMFEATDLASIQRVISEIKLTGAKVVIFDTLKRIAGDLDENLSEIDKALYAIRRIVEQTGALAIVIHHANKAGGLRGSTAISGAVDMVIKTEREDQSTTFTLGAEKTRQKTFRPLQISFDYRNDEHGELKMAAFRCVGYAPGKSTNGAHDSAAQKADACIDQILGEKMSTAEVIDGVRKMGGPSANIVRDVLNRKHEAGLIAREANTGQGGGYLWSNVDGRALVDINE